MGTQVNQDSNSKQAAGYSWLPPFVATLFYVCINAMSWRELDERNVQVPTTAKKARVFLMCILFSVMCAVVGAAYSACAGPARPFPAAALSLLKSPPRHATQRSPPLRAAVMVDKFLKVPGSFQWAGISTLVSTLLITFAAFIQRFATLPPGAGS